VHVGGRVAEGWRRRDGTAPWEQTGVAVDRSGAAHTLLVLGYHNVHGTWCFPARPGEGAKGLERQLRVLRRLCTIVPLASALHDLSDGRPLPPRALAITFDDGYRDNLTIAGPMLRRLGVPATCFLVPGILSGETDPWWERLAWAFARASVPQVVWEGEQLATGDVAARRRALDRVSDRLKTRTRRERGAAVGQLVGLLEPAGGGYDPREMFLDWDGARALGEYMELGSHTMYHAILSQEDAEAQHDDLARSRDELRRGTGAEIGVLAYPNGKRADYDDATLSAAAAAGYDHAITTERGWNRPSTPRHEIRRWVMNPERGLVDLGKFVRDARLLRN
jgi:peptidoglycan/xylan/chitin deacetylase (PgdA/CDA1 family)